MLVHCMSGLTQFWLWVSESSCLPIAFESSCLQATANLKQSALAYQPPIMQPVHNFRICQLQMILNCAPIFYRGARGRGVRCMGSTKCMKFGRLLSLPVAKNLPLTFLAKHFGRSFAQIRCSGSLTADESFVSPMPVHHEGKLLLEIIIQFHGEIFFDAIYATLLQNLFTFQFG